MAYRHRGYANLYPADAVLNLPEARHSHAIRKLAAVEAAPGSFEEAAGAVAPSTGQPIDKCQTESLTARAADDVADFLRQQTARCGPETEVLVISADGKGILMRPDSLRPATATAAVTTKLATRLSKGEKRNRKRLAEVGTVYDLSPIPRIAT